MMDLIEEEIEVTVKVKIQYDPSKEGAKEYVLSKINPVQAISGGHKTFGMFSIRTSK